MEWSRLFLINSIMLGVGLAMDAFSVSLANGMHEPSMKWRRRFLIAGCFAFFQFLMPLIGWGCVHTIVEYFRSFEKLIPWIALILLGYIGGKMLLEGIQEQRSRNNGETQLPDEKPSGSGTVSELLLQGVATSIDALSVGFTIANYGLVMAFVCSLIIAVVTFVICVAGVQIGRRAGMLLAGKATILGGVILIAIGLEIFFS